MKKNKVAKNKQLLVEGNDDQHVVWALCEKYNLLETFDVIDCKGIDSLIDSIPIRLKQSGIETLGIIIDADTDIEARWLAIRNVLLSVGYTNILEEVPKEGFIHSEDGKPKIGVWLMPNNNQNGMLEDFIEFLIPKDDRLLSIAKSTLDSIETENCNEYRSIHHSKALIHTWLAWQEDPGTPMGLSITKKYLDPSVKQCTTFVDWLKILFE